MRVDRTIFEKLLVKAEAGVHRNGWDQPPFLATIEMPRDTLISLIELPIEIHDPPGKFLEWLGKQVLDDTTYGASIAEGAPDLKGFAFVCEAWMKDEPTAKAMKALSDSGKSLADIPGSIETRTLTAIDLHGRMYQIIRERGKKPYVLDHSDPAVSQPGGNVFRGLYYLTLAVARELPDNQEYLDALEPLFIDSIDEMVLREEIRQRPGSSSSVLE